MSNTIRNFSTSCLAPDAIRKAWKEYEWVPVSAQPNTELNVSQYRNLFIRCHSCEAELCDGDTASDDCLCSCGDCGGREFDVLELAQSQEVDVPAFCIRLSRKGFLRMELPQDLKQEFSIHYTLDGSTPTRSSQRFAKPFPLPSNITRVRARLYGVGVVSKIYALDMPHEGTCPLCRCEIMSSEPNCTCTGCGCEVQWDEKGGAWVPDPLKVPSFKCVDCGATVLATSDVCRCSECDAIYHKEGDRWLPGEDARHLRCEICSADIKMQGDHVSCPSCRASYSLVNGGWTCKGIPHICNICGASLFLTPTNNHCPRCRAEYEARSLKTGRIICQGANIKCLKCGQNFKIESENNAECDHCKTRHDFDPVSGKWVIHEEHQPAPQPPPPSGGGADMLHGGICPHCRREIKSSDPKCACTVCGCEVQWNEKKQAWVRIQRRREHLPEIPPAPVHKGGTKSSKPWGPARKTLIVLVGVLLLAWMGNLVSEEDPLVAYQRCMKEGKEAEALEHLHEAAEAGNSEAQNELGHCYLNGLAVGQDFAEAVKWFRTAAERGNANAQLNLGLCYESGNGVSRDYAMAVKWYLAAAEQGNAVAQLSLGNCYCYGQGVSRDYAMAVKWYRASAEQGNAVAQCSLGNCYYNGQGVSQNYIEAAKWYRAAAEQGNAIAQSNLGNCYYNGQGVSRNYIEAAEWYRESAEQGNAIAQSNLGNCYYNGQGVSQNYIEAAEWYRKASEQGNAIAQCSLGDCYYYGQGVSRNYIEAAIWYRESAYQGFAPAQFNLGMCYYNGEGVDKDIEAAKRWLRAAAEQGYGEAKNVLRRYNF